MYTYLCFVLYLSFSFDIEHSKRTKKQNCRNKYGNEQTKNKKLFKKIENHIYRYIQEGLMWMKRKTF